MTASCRRQVQSRVAGPGLRGAEWGTADAARSLVRHQFVFFGLIQGGVGRPQVQLGGEHAHLAGGPSAALPRRRGLPRALRCSPEPSIPHPASCLHLLLHAISISGLTTSLRGEVETCGGVPGQSACSSPPSPPTPNSHTHTPGLPKISPSQLFKFAPLYAFTITKALSA